MGVGQRKLLGLHSSQHICCCCLVAKSCPTLREPMDGSRPGSSVHGIIQARILEWVAMPSSRGSSQPRIKPTSLTSPALAGEFFTTSTIWEAQCVVYNFQNHCCSQPLSTDRKPRSLRILPKVTAKHRKPGTSGSQPMVPSPSRAIQWAQAILP